jgi:hypothetical protein
MLVYALPYGNSLPHPKPVERIFRTTVHQRPQRWLLAPPNRGEKKMYQQHRHIEDPLTSVIALFVLAALGFFGLLVLMLTLALGF